MRTPGLCSLERRTKNDGLIQLFRIIKKLAAGWRHHEALDYIKENETIRCNRKVISREHVSKGLRSKPFAI